MRRWVKCKEDRTEKEKKNIRNQRTEMQAKCQSERGRQWERIRTLAN